MKLTFFAVLGLAIDDTGGAAELLPKYLFRTPGYHPLPEAAGPVEIAAALDNALTFRNVRFGADAEVKFENEAGQISFAADVDCAGVSETLYLRQLPDVGFKILATRPESPARVFAAVDKRGAEVIIESLPVEVQLPLGLLTPDPPGADVGDANAFGGFPDSVNYVLSATQPSRLQVMARVHLRTDDTVLFETSVPVNIGWCRFTGLPVARLYDFMVIPSPERREEFEWIRHDVAASFGTPVTGAIAVRSIDFRVSDPPFSDLKKYLGGDDWSTTDLELVCEDVVFPVMMPATVPLPLHGMFGVRRKLAAAGESPFALGKAPYKVLAYGNKDRGWYASLYDFLFRSGAMDDPAVFMFHGAVEKKGASSGLFPDAFTLELTDEWTLAAGVAWDENPPFHFKILGLTVSLQGGRFGISVDRLWQGSPFGDSFLVVGDFHLQSEPSDGIVRIESVTGGPIDVVLRGFGWSLGNFSLGLEAAPSGMRFVFVNSVVLLVEDWGWVEEPTGVEYFSISGGVELGIAKGEKNDEDYGLRFRRLRFRAEEVDSAPAVLLDGLTLKLVFGTFKITGFGFLSDFLEAPWHVREWGFGVDVEFDALGQTFGVAAEFFRGTRTNTTDESISFSYFLAAAKLKFLPAGTFDLLDIRALVAQNLQPDVTPAGEGEGLTLYHWYRAHLSGGLVLPGSRGLDGWMPVDNAVSVGVGLGFSFVGFRSKMHIDLFCFLTWSEDARGLLIVGELFLLEAPEPIAWVAVEYDAKVGKFGVLIGVDVALTDLLGKVDKLPKWMKNLAHLSGSLYVGNLPGTFQIGQLADQRTWLGVRAHNDWIVFVDFVLAICVQWSENGPCGFGLILTISGGSDWGIGGFIVFGNFGLIIALWKTEAQTTSAEIWIELGFRIHLFFVFNFGASVELRVHYLGREPWFTTMSLTIEIETPWWLPSATVKFEVTFRQALPFETASAPQPLSSAEGIGDGDHSAEKLLAPPLAGEKNLYSFEELVGIGVEPPSGEPPLLATTSTVALVFSVPMSNDMAVAPDTGDAGVQKVQDLTLRYALQSIKVRRRPRWGSSVWTEFVAESQTTLPAGAGNVTIKPSLSFDWDLAVREDGKLSPSRLLLNASSPYTFNIGGAQQDEEVLRNDDTLPCCDERIRLPRQFTLSFFDHTAGRRLPASQQFAKDGAWWHWSTAPAPLAAPSIVAADNGFIVARVHPFFSSTIGSVDFAEPAITAKVWLDWSAAKGKVTLDAMHGIELLQRHELDLAQPSKREYAFNATHEKPITRLTMRVKLGIAPETDIDLQIVRVIYVTAKDQAAFEGAQTRCENNGGPFGNGGAGKIAWLPNHDYEIVVKSSVAMTYASQGTRELTLEQGTYFRTKGLPGLNATKNVGDELTPFVESIYPRSTKVPLYRDEPAALAFTEGMSALLPVDRVPFGGDPAEKTQLYELALNVDRIASFAGGEGVPVAAKEAVRKATSRDPGTLRFETLLASAPRCKVEPLHSSQVLLHEPVGATGWERQSTYRATVRRKGAPHESWSVSGGETFAPMKVFGELSWNHLQIHARVERNGAAAAGLAIGLSDAPGVLQGVFATMEGAKLVLRRKLSGAVQAEESIDLPAAAGIVAMSLFAFDDRVRAVVGGVSLEIDRGAVRDGRAALVADGPAKVHSLLVDGLDLYRFDFKTSRYRTFEEHVATFSGAIDSVSPLAPSPSVAQWTASHGSELAAVMSAGADAPSRQALFTDLVTSAAIPLRERVERVSIARFGAHADVEALVIESPEPLAFSRDIAAELSRKKLLGKLAVWNAVPSQILTNGDETVAILLPGGAPSFAKGDYRLKLQLARERWRAAAPDALSTLSASATIVFSV